MMQYCAVTRLKKSLEVLGWKSGTIDQVNTTFSRIYGHGGKLDIRNMPELMFNAMVAEFKRVHKNQGKK